MNFRDESIRDLRITISKERAEVERLQDLVTKQKEYVGGAAERIVAANELLAECRAVFAEIKMGSWPGSKAKILCDQIFDKLGQYMMAGDINGLQL